MINETPLQQTRESEPISDVTTTWFFPPLFAPPLREDGQSVLNHGSHWARGWQTGWAQAIGKKHRICEDSLALRWVATPSQTKAVGLVAALGDGVGGGARGDVASHAIVRHCTRCVDASPFFDGTPQAQLCSWLIQGDVEVNKALCHVTTKPGASTLAAAWLNENGQGWVTRVGDSRAYIFRDMSNDLSMPDHVMFQLLQDQTYLKMGEPAPQADQGDAPARMVGAGLIGQPEVIALQMEVGEVLMLSSDGLHQWVPVLEIARILKEEKSLETAANKLVAYALAQGSDDDISVLLVGKI